MIDEKTVRRALMTARNVVQSVSSSSSQVTDAHVLNPDRMNRGGVPGKNVKEDSPAKRMIDDVYSSYPAHPFYSDQRGIMHGKDQVGIFKLSEHPFNPKSVFIDWLAAHPQRSGIGTKTLDALKEHAAQYGTTLSLSPWDKGTVSKSALKKFYTTKNKFNPVNPNAPLGTLMWSPEDDQKSDPDDITKSGGGEVEPKLRTDNPGGEWLEEQKNLSAKAGNHPSGAPKRFGAVTGNFRENLTLPLSVLSVLKGVSGEQANVRQNDLDWLKNHMQSGKLPPISDDDETEYAPFVTVDQNGRPWVNEGNHRIMAAHELGWRHMPVSVRYFSGGERVDGPFHPDRLLALHRHHVDKPRIAKAESGDDITKSGGGEVDHDYHANLAKFMESAHPEMFDEQGKPKTIYHGTSLNRGLPELGIRNFDGSHIAGWFSETPQRAENYANLWPADEEDQFSGAHLYPAHVSLKNPFVFNKDVSPNDHHLLSKDAIHHLAHAAKAHKTEIENLFSHSGIPEYAWELIESKPFVDFLKRKKFDGIIQHESGHKTFGAFYPHQIKSAIGNRGTFDPHEADITKSEGGEVDDVPHKKFGGDLDDDGVSDFTPPKLRGTQIMKEPGGQWLSGSVEGSMSPLKTKTVATYRGTMETPELAKEIAERGISNIEKHPENSRDTRMMQLNDTLNTANRAKSVNDFVGKQLTRYVKNDMGTEGDPIRALAERGILHYVPHQNGNEHQTQDIEHDADLHRRGRGRASNSLAKQWENNSDLAIDQFEKSKVDKDTINENPWLDKLEPHDVVNGLFGHGVHRYLGFDHLIDELHNSVNPESGLPDRLQLRPESLARMSVPQAVQHVHNINEWREDNIAEANKKLAFNEATHLHKDYPGTDYAWYEIKHPEMTDEEKLFVNSAGSEDEKIPEELERKKDALEEALTYEGDCMGHCVGGYSDEVADGSSRIFSLRNKKTGAPHVTIETSPRALVRSDLVNHLGGNEKLADDYLEKGFKLRQDAWTSGDKHGLTPLGHALRLAGVPKVDDISQIKGKGNAKPIDRYLPYVQDFIQSGNWGRIGDLHNTGLRRMDELYSGLTDRMKEAGEHIPKYMTEEEFHAAQKRHFPHAATGGAIIAKASGGVVDPQKAIRRAMGIARSMKGDGGPSVEGTLGQQNQDPVTFMGKQPHELTPAEWAQFGEHHGVANMGPSDSAKWRRSLQRIKTRSGRTMTVPGGINSTEPFSYYDMLHLKSQGIDPNDLDPEVHQKIHDRMISAMQPKGKPSNIQVANQMMFGMISPNQPLTPNELALQRIMVKGPKDMKTLAEMIPYSYKDDQPASIKKRQEYSRGITTRLGLHAAERGGLGASGSANYSDIAEFMQKMRDNPEFFTFDPTTTPGNSPSEKWSNHVGKVINEVRGLSAKTGSLASVWQSPKDAAISAIDRHMATKFKDNVFEDPKQQKEWEKKTLDAFNVDRKNKDRVKSINDLLNVQGGRGHFVDSILAHVNTLPTAKTRVKKTGEYNPRVPEALRNIGWVSREPETMSLISGPYVRALEENQRHANAAGQGLFSNQWMQWDRIRGRLEPHEILFPGLEKMPRMSLEQMRRVRDDLSKSGYMAAEGTVDPLPTASHAGYFAKGGIVTPEGESNDQFNQPRPSDSPRFKRDRELADAVIQARAATGSTPSIPRTYRRVSGVDGGRSVGANPALRGLISAIHEPHPQAKQIWNGAGMSSPHVVSLRPGAKSADLFHSAIAASKANHPHGPAVTLYSPEEYRQMRLFMTPDMGAGFALKGNDIVSVFNHKDSPHRNVSNPLLDLAIQQGGRKLDAFDTVLPHVYSRSGFGATSRLPWSEEHSPPDWNHETFQDFNGGRPDVVFMAHDPHKRTLHREDSLSKYAQDYDSAVHAQDAAVSLAHPAEKDSTGFSHGGLVDHALKMVAHLTKQR